MMLDHQDEAAVCGILCWEEDKSTTVRVRLDVMMTGDLGVGLMQIDVVRWT